MVGELVIAHTMVAEDPAIRAEDHQTLLKNITRSSKIVRELQDLSMAIGWCRFDPPSRECRAWCATCLTNWERKSF